MKIERTKSKLAAMLTMVASGRAMTLLFLGSAGSGTVGSAPAGWTMPLLGDAIVGIGAPIVAWAIWRESGFLGWLLALIWCAIAIWDALSAWVVHVTVPWDGFFMTQLFGWTMFPAAVAMHLVIAGLLVSARRRFFRLDLGDSLERT